MWKNLDAELEEEFGRLAVFMPGDRYDQHTYRVRRYDDNERERAKLGMRAIRAARYAAGWTRTRSGWVPPLDAQHADDAHVVDGAGKVP